MTRPDLQFFCWATKNRMTPHAKPWPAQEHAARLTQAYGATSQAQRARVEKNELRFNELPVELHDQVAYHLDCKDAVTFSRSTTKDGKKGWRSLLSTSFGDVAVSLSREIAYRFLCDTHRARTKLVERVAKGFADLAQANNDGFEKLKETERPLFEDVLTKDDANGIHLRWSDTVVSMHDEDVAKFKQDATEFRNQVNANEKFIYTDAAKKVF